jgi:arylsulfatase A-like enzyme
LSAGRLVLLMAAFACALAPGCKPPRAERVVLITLDTTRADHLGCYGNANARTPALDALAADGVVFENALCTVPVTLPSHATIFTGLYPGQHGVRYNGVYFLGEEQRTIAEQLRERGFATGAVPASFAVARRFGLGQGFTDYEDLFEGPHAAGLPKTAERKATDVAARGIRWLEAHASGPAFLWLHFYDPHFPYDPPFPFNQEFRERPYDGEIAAMDKALGTLFDHLRKDAAAWKNTLLIVVADHGEGLFEHGEPYHGTLVYQSTMRVPLIVKAPGADAGHRSPSFVSTVDLVPTILDYVGAPANRALPGTSLRGALEGGSIATRPLYFESWSGAISFGWARLDGIARGAYKLISGAELELYDLAADPDERADLAQSDGGRAQELGEELADTTAAWEAAGDSDKNRVTLDPEAQERLASLGYIGGVAPSSAHKAGADARKLIHLEGELLRAQELSAEREWPGVVEACSFALAHDADNRLALYFLARAYLALNRATEAIPPADRLAKRYTDFELGHDTLGLALRLAGRIDDSVQAYSAGMEFLPDSKLLHFRYVLALFDAQRPADACAQSAKDLARWPTDRHFLLLRARCEARAGDTRSAVATLAQVADAGLDPRPYAAEAPELRAAMETAEGRRLAARWPEKPD